MSNPQQGDKLLVINNQTPENSVTIVPQPNAHQVSINTTPEKEIIQIVLPGPPGGKGERGIPGPTGSNPPFFIIEPTLNYATTSSVAFHAPIISNLYSSGSYSLGTQMFPWSSLYLHTGSISFRSGVSELVTLTPSQNRLYLGDMFFSTSSIGYDNDDVLSATPDLVVAGRHTDLHLQMTVDTISVKKNSELLFKVESDGRIVIKDVGTLPTPTSASIIFRSGEMYITT